MYHWVFHCSFSLHTQHISLRFFITYLAHFIVVFHYIPCAFHWSFSLYTQCISLRFFIRYPAHFIMVFHYIPSGYHCGFSLHTQCLSLRFFKCIPGYFIAIFHWIPSAFHCDFSLDTGRVVTWPITKNGQKTKIVALHCSFPNLVELCSEVLPLWRYEVKDFEKRHVVFGFLHFSPWKQHQIRWFHHIWKAKRRGYNYAIVGKFTQKGRCIP